MQENILTGPKKKKKGYFLVVAGVLLLAFLGAAGVGFQNFTAFFEVLVGGFALANAPALGLAIVAGGVCSTAVNFFLNAELLYDFYRRVTKKPLPALSAAGKVQYVIGTGVFVITGVLYGMTAFSVAAAGGLSALGVAGILAITVGIFVSIITIFQELETWLVSFDNPLAVEIHIKVQKLEFDPKAKVETVIDRLLIKLQELKTKQEKELKDGEDKKQQKNQRLQLLLDKNNEVQVELALLSTQFLAKQLDKNEVIQAIKKLQADAEKIQPSLPNSAKNWWEKFKSNPIAYVTGLIVSLGNVMALSLLFTIGLTTFLIFVGVAALPALIIGFSAAFTAGAFTEFYFYQGFLTDFCDKIKTELGGLTPKWRIGLVAVLVNGIINAVLAYFGVQMLPALFSAAGIVVLPLLPLSIVCAVFAGLASVLLGTSFLIRFPEFIGRFKKKFGKWFGDSQEKTSNKEDGLKSERESLLNNVDIQELKNKGDGNIFEKTEQEKVQDQKSFLPFLSGASLN